MRKIAAPSPERGPGTLPGRIKYHSHFPAALKMKFLNPREVINAALTGVDEGRAPIEAVEGVVRQVIGWREFTYGLYWREDRKSVV
jgi:deoxyribodipyrimidine photolyase-like uncharacterized protein